MDLRSMTRKIQGRVGVKVDGIYGPQTARAILANMTETGIDLPNALPPEEIDDHFGKAGEFDKRTEKNLATLQPKAREKFDPFVRRAIAVAASMGVTAKVICGERDKAAQEEAKAKGASRAGYGYSWHNYGMAIDFGLFVGRSYIDSDDPTRARAVYQAIGALAPSYGIEWGGSWKSFVDLPHFQLGNVPKTPTASHRAQLANGSFRYV